jgi:hypothetical protein
MKTFLLTLFLAAGVSAAMAQSAVYVYQNPDAAEADYMCMRGMTDQHEAELLTRQKLEELVNNTEQIKRYASTNSKGFGAVVRTQIKLSDGRNMPIFGAALGCKSAKEAEKKAVQNLKELNPEWKGNTYLVVHQFRDR